MVRFILAVLVGVAFGTGVVYVCELAQQAAFPLPAGVDPMQPTELSRYLQSGPVNALAALIALWVLAAAIGAFAAAKLSERIHAGWIAGGLLLAATCLNFTMIVHPVWMIAATLIALPLAVWAASRAGAH